MNITNLPRGFLWLSVTLAILIRWVVSLYPYSGQSKPPLFGDYEAQRHWQEITLHIPVKQWYVNTTQNDLQYWGLDYPPLTAYHSLAMGHVADIVDPESVVLFSSRGYESHFHKLFMRWTVFVSDMYFYIPAMVGFSYVNYKLKTKELKAQGMSTLIKNVFFQPEVSALIALLFPGIILIDYGHFQYNCVSLGLFVWATMFILLNKLVLASIFFVLAVNYKQMELYHSLPFFLYLLRQCVPSQRKSAKYCVTLLVKIALTVIVTFGIIWLPFLTGFDSISQVLFRLFPVARGVFEDKVANVWCSVNIFIKLKKIFDNATMAKVCLAATGVALLPSSLDLFLRPNVKKFILSLINSSLAFFLFSFQVHEKTILLCAIPVLLHLPLDPVPCLWFLLVSNFSMLPLLMKDGLLLAYIATSILFLSVFSVVLMMMDKNIRFMDVFNVTKINNILKGTQNQYNGLFYKMFNIFFILSTLVMFVLTVASVFVSPPKQYPDLFPLLVSSFSCVNFLMFYIYFNYCQIIIPNESTNIVIKKVK